MIFPDRFFARGTKPASFEKWAPAPCFRKSFTLNKDIKTAELSICGLGFYELFINGVNITRSKLAPYIYNPDDFLYYDCYDISQYLQTGENVVAVILGNGILNSIGGQVWDFDNADFRSAPKFALAFNAVLKDNSEIIFGGEAFKSNDSPIIFNDLRCGEWYDARKELGEWTKPNFDDSGWQGVITAAAPKGKPRLCDVDPVITTEILHPVSIRKSRVSIYPVVEKGLPDISVPDDESSDKGYLYDFGINASGVRKLTLRNARPGQKIVLQFGEITGELLENGDTKRDSSCGLDLRGIHFLPHRFNNRDIYICKGGKLEEWTPAFTYHGFRYCLVSSIDDEQATEELLSYEVQNTFLKAAKIPYARNHDASFCPAYGGEHSVDVHAIFPDFNKNPYDEDSYDFALTDDYLSVIKKAGTEVFYRLGSKIEHSRKKYGTIVPADFHKWAVICEHIIRHYNEGWANGFNMNIEYWEIWNEPDGKKDSGDQPNWSGTSAEFYELYIETATHLKSRFPDLKIGGPAVSCINIDWLEGFFKALTKDGKKTPLDFFSWHGYTTTPGHYIAEEKRVRELLNKYGYAETESILNEYNYVENWTDGFIPSIEAIISMKGAAFTSAVMLESQNSTIDMLMYYDARPTVFNGMFDFYTYRPLKGYYPFVMFSKLYALGTAVSCNSDDEDIYSRRKK